MLLLSYKRHTLLDMWGCEWSYSVAHCTCLTPVLRYLSLWNLKPTNLIFVSSIKLSSWNLMAHGDAWEGNWRRNWRMDWVASTLTLPRNTVHPTLLPLMRTPRLPAVDWTDAPADLNGLVRFAERPTEMLQIFLSCVNLHNSRYAN